MSWCGPLWVHLVWDFLWLYAYFLHQVREVSHHYFFHIGFSISCSPSGTSMMWMSVCLSQSLLKLPSFFLDSFFLFAVSIGYFLLYYLPKLCCDPLFHLLHCWFSDVFFISVNVFFVSHWFFMFFISLFVFPISLFKFSLSLPTCLQNLMRIFMTITLNSLSSRWLIFILFRVFFPGVLCFGGTYSLSLHFCLCVSMYYWK